MIKESKAEANLKKGINEMFRIEDTKLEPWWRGFRGRVEQNNSSYLVSVRITLREISNSKVICVVSEIPIGKDADDVKAELSAMAAAGYFSDFKDEVFQCTYRLYIELGPEKSAEFCRLSEAAILKQLGLITSFPVSNFVLFKIDQKPKKYMDWLDIIQDHLIARLEVYAARKQHLLKKLEDEAIILDNICRFIQEVIKGSLKVNGRKRNELVEELRSRGFFSTTSAQPSSNSESTANQPENSGRGEIASSGTQEVLEQKEKDEGFDYLLGMKIWSLTKERADALMKQQEAKHSELQALYKKGEFQIWLEELEELENELVKFEEEWMKDVLEDAKKKIKQLENKKENKSKKRKGLSGKNWTEAGDEVPIDEGELGKVDEKGIKKSLTEKKNKDKKTKDRKTEKGKAKESQPKPLKVKKEKSKPESKKEKGLFERLGVKSKVLSKTKVPAQKKVIKKAKKVEESEDIESLNSETVLTNSEWESFDAS